MIKNQFHKREAVRYAQQTCYLRQRLRSTHAIAVLLLLILSLGSAKAGILWGDLRGVTLDPTGKALSGVEVTIHDVDEDTTRTVVSGSEGTFRVIDLHPGRYQLTGQKVGFARAPQTTVRVAGGQDQTVYLIMLPQDAPGSTQSHLLPRAPAEGADLHGTAVQASPDVSLPATNLARPLGPTSTSAQQEQLQILKELEAMKQRIAELEARLANQMAPRQSVAVAPTPSVNSAEADAPAAAKPALVAVNSPKGSTPPQGVKLDENATSALSTGQPTLVAMNAPLESSISLARGVAPEKTEAASRPSKPALGMTSGPKASPVNVVPAATPQAPAKIVPFSDADWTWLNGNPRTKDIYWDTKFFTPEIRADINYNYDFNHPTDHSMGGSSEIFRSNEVQVEQLGVGGDFHYANVRARLLTQFGMYSQTTPRNDASPGHGQWDLDTAYRYVSEAYGGYHFDVLHGVNVDAGIFMSYIGLFSYYNFDNWAYQPSYVSSNTPWFFNGVRIQIFPTAHLKIEPWFINGWQAYASANHRPGLGGQIKWTPKPWINVISNNYGLGHDDLFVPNRGRIHTDNSLEVKYYDRPERRLDKMAFSLTGDMGCEFGGGVSCDTNTKNGPKQSFLGYMAYNRFWFKKDLYGLTVGGGRINNPGRYLVLIPPINGETAISAATNSPYFTENPGDPFKAWDSSITFDWMPKQYITFRWEYSYRHASVPYWSGKGGITPPGGNNGYPTEFACMDGSPSLTIAGCAANGGLWTPDLRKDESFLDFDILVKF